MLSIDIMFYNNCNWDDVIAVFSSSYGDIMPHQMKMQNIYGKLYRCSIGLEHFNYVYFTCKKGICTVLTSFNRHCFAFMPNGCSFNGILCLEIYHMMPDIPDIKKIIFNYDNKIQKAVYIWTPKSYTHSSNKKYGVIYMFDGQNLFYKNSTGYGSWNVHQTMELTGGYIVVGVDNADIYRDSQLTPELGMVRENYIDDFSHGTGAEFAQFIINKIIPYINANYNVFTDKEHTAVCGSSSGGLESFYIGMLYNNIFGCVGALSPALALYDSKIWNAFFQQIALDTPPRLYMYIGNNDPAEKELSVDVVKMKDYLDNKLEYKSEIIFDYIKDNYHNEACWSGAFIRFADMLE